MNSFNLSIITATYNATEHLPKLIESLRNQEDKNFEWVIADGGSTDGTIELIKSVTDLKVVLTSKEDFGIYDALNRGIKASNSEFYLVTGADDTLTPNAVKDFRFAMNENSDIITAPIKAGRKIFYPSKKPAWLVGQRHYISGHAVGTVFKKSLHDRFGYYSRKYPIAADQLFVLKSARNNARITILRTVVGEFNLMGVSHNDLLGATTEAFRVQVAVGFNKYIQLILFLLRVLKRITKIG